jgi:acetylornithine deacetylase
MTQPPAPAAGVWRSRLLDYLDGHAGDMVADLAALVRVASISGTAKENAVQGMLSARLDGNGLDVDTWPIPMAETLAA